MKSKVTWKDGLAFDADVGGHHFDIDADEQFGGREAGPRPKALLLTALAGCTGMDVMSILGKMRVSVDRFEVDCDGQLADEHPKKYVRISTRYWFWGEDLPLNKVRRAVKLSEERYCGISATLEPAVDMQSEIWVNGVKLADDDA